MNKEQYRDGLIADIKGQGASHEDACEVVDLALHASDEAIEAIERITRNASSSKNALISMILGVTTFMGRGEAMMALAKDMIRDAAA
jgi:hypothetical protein